MDLELGAELVSLLGLSGEVLPLTLLQNVLPIRNRREKIRELFCRAGHARQFFSFATKTTRQRNIASGTSQGPEKIEK